MPPALFSRTRAVVAKRTGKTCGTWCFLLTVVGVSLYGMLAVHPFSASPSQRPRRALADELPPLRVFLVRDRGDAIDVAKTTCAGKGTTVDQALDAALKCLGLSSRTAVEFSLQTTAAGEFVALVLANNVDETHARDFVAFEGAVPLDPGFARARDVVRPWLVTAGRPPGIC